MAKRQRSDYCKDGLYEFLHRLLFESSIGGLTYTCSDVNINFEQAFWDVFGYIRFFPRREHEDPLVFATRMLDHVTNDRYSTEQMGVLLNAFRTYQNYVEQLHHIRVELEHNARFMMEKSMNALIK